MINDLKEQGWAMVEDFLSAKELQFINQAFTGWQRAGLFSPAKIGQGERLQHRPEIRGDETWWFDLLNPPVELTAVLEKILQLKTALNRELYLGLKDWQVHLASYAPGRGYQKHLDRHQESSHRKLSLILYLNQHWEQGWGGELVLYQKSGSELKRILPLGGRLVAFLSEDFPHEVLAAKQERRSLTGWFLDAPVGGL